MLRVVLVEDSIDVQAALRSLLAMIPGVQVVGGAADSANAQRLLDAQRPDLVILDVALLGRDRGMDVLHHVRRHHPGTEVIVLSNLGWQALRSGFFEAGAAAYFDKALQFEDACDWIRQRAART